MAKTSLITLHGMGATQPDYHLKLVQALEDVLGPRARDVVTHPVYYQDLLQANEAAVWQACRDQVRFDELRQFLLYGFADAAGLESRKEDAQSVYELSQRKIADAFLAAREIVGPQGRVVVIAHSLGGQVLSNYLYDAQKAAKARTGQPGTSYPRAGMWQQQYVEDGSWDAARLAFASGATIRALYTTGCNIPVFVAAHKRMQIVPIDKPNATFEWHNFFDPDDVLGWPLEPLGDGYRAMVQDHRINSGHGPVDWLLKSWNPLAHATYWTDDDVVRPLAQQLAHLMDAPP